MYSLGIRCKRDKIHDAVLNEQLAPEIIQALIAQAHASGLTVNEYLRWLLNLATGAQPGELALAGQPQPRNEEMLAIIRRNKERLKDMPVRGSTADTLKMIREARAGAMWRYEPTDTA
jgi:type II secretory pathway predicted ATPase ExeA